MDLPYPLYSKFELGDMTILYMRSGERLVFSLIPAGTEALIPTHRTDLNDTVPYRSNRRATGNDAKVVKDGSMIQLHLMGDPFSCSDTMHGSASAARQKLLSQTRDGRRIVTTFADDRGVETAQILEYRPGAEYVTIFTEVRNRSGRDIELGMVEAVSIGMISPFHADNAPDALKIHRWSSAWSGEGHELVHDPDDLALGVPWNGGGMHEALRFGQRCSKVARGWFPSAVVSDETANVSWSIQLATVRPWQIVVSREGDFLELSGGPADFDFANWRLTLRPGESFATFPAVVSCVRGSAADALARTKEYPVADAPFPMPATERDLPVIFNEFCTTWGAPAEWKLRPVIERLKGLGCRYFVIDGGWGRDDRTMLPGIGDWIPAPSIYPSGFDALLEEIRSAGMIPGIWFEFECASGSSALYREHPDWFIRFEGREYALDIDRHFLDLRKEAVIEFLDERVIGFLRDHRFGYMKVDYNAQFRLADCARGSAAAGAAEVLEAVRSFYEKIRRALPELVVEICASGGQRLSPGWLRLGSMASFSDCHEGYAAPLIAAATERQIPFRMNQVWCTLRRGESPRRTGYLLAGGFIGRLCLSGDAAEWSEFQMDAVRRAIALYKGAGDILENGRSVLEQHLATRDWNAPKGYQIFRRVSAQGEAVVIHLFEEAPTELEIPVSFRRIAGALSNGESMKIEDGVLRLEDLAPMSGLVLILR